MRRALGYIFIVAACVMGFLSVRGTMPFMPIFGVSMEPTLHNGSLLMIAPADPRDVKVGDIIVYNVPGMVRDTYNYPPVVAHRVIKVITTPSLGFRTKGDNTGEDPFTIRPQDIRGTVGDQIPYLGLPLLFFQSQQGLIFIIAALSLLALFLYSGELGLAGKKVQRGMFAPVIDETYRNNRVLTHKIEVTEKKMDTTQQALEKFASAISVYAEHLASHTSAIQGLSQASQELSKSAAEQNRVLAHIMQVVEQPKQPGKEAGISIEKPVPEREKAMPRAEKTQFPPGCARSRKEAPADPVSSGKA